MRAATSLPEAQRGFQSGVLAGALPRALIAADPGGNADERFAIYARGYRTRLTGALRTNYPVLHRVLGDEAFEALAAAFIAAAPSARRSIRWFGEALHGFVDREPDRLPHPALADLIAMEWALGLAFDAADVAPGARVAIADLQRIAPDAWHALRFALAPSATVLAMSWAVEPTVRALKADEHAAVCEPEAHAHRLVIWRQGLEAVWRALEPDEADALQGLAAGATFGDLCAALARKHGADTAAALAARMLAGWIHSGLLVQRAT